MTTAPRSGARRSGGFGAVGLALAAYPVGVELYGLLSPCCVCMNSSPARIIGVPFDKNSSVQKFLI